MVDQRHISLSTRIIFTKNRSKKPITKDNIFFLALLQRGLAVKPFPNKPWFLRVCSTSLWKTQWEKEKLLVTSNFSFSHSVFYHFIELSAIFFKFEIVVCKLFQFGRD